MKKYKCIKSYPHGPEIGKEIHDSWEGESRSLSNFPEFWELVEEETYKIIRFSDGYNTYFRGDNGKFTINTAYYYTEKRLFEINCTIQTVKRLCDNKIFTIGSIVFFKGNTFLKYKVDTIFKYEGELLIQLDSGKSVRLEELSLVEPTEFITEDGKELTEKDEFWVVATNKYNLVGNKPHTFPDFSKDKTKYLRFSTKEAAINYIVLNKEILSITDLYAIMTNMQTFSPCLIEKAETIVKYKIDLK